MINDHNVKLTLNPRFWIEDFWTMDFLQHALQRLAHLAREDQLGLQASFPQRVSLGAMGSKIWIM